MEVNRRIYESLPNIINVPTELRRRRVEVIILPLDNNGGGKDKLSDEEYSRALEDLLKHAGDLKSGNLNGGDNDLIDADIAREYGKDL